MYNNRKKEAHMKKRRKSVENLAVRSKMLNFAVKYRIRMNKKSTLLFLMSVFMFAFAQTAQAQDIILNNSNHGKTKNTCSGYLYDNSKTGNYEANQDRWVTICPPASTGNTGRISLTFEEFDIDVSDTVYIYQGPSINDPLLIPDAVGITYYQGNSLLNKTVISPLTAPSGCLTIRLITDDQDEGTGFKARIECASMCQYPEAALDSVFYRIDEAGNKIARPVRDGVDTIIGDDGSVSLIRFKSVDFCYGDSIVLVANPVFPENDNLYHQDASNCIYEWTFGDGQSQTVNYNPEVGHKWTDFSGYDLFLVVEDTANGGCRSRNTIDTRIRMATNPIKTVQRLPDMCSGTQMGFVVGYGANSQIIVDSLEFSRSEKERFEGVTFIPDGPTCEHLTPTGCFNVPVTFDNFPSGSTVSSVDDIMSICMNVEHSYLGDLEISIVCPNGQSTILKYYGGGGGNTFLGQPIDDDGRNCCDSTCAPIGVGWTYCFSNQYLNGQMGVMGKITATNLPQTNVEDTSGYFQTPIQQGAVSTADKQTVDLNGFQSLVGCPLNGEWAIMICDRLSIDNGYVFWWDLELGQSSAANWDYQVPIDTVIWSGPTFFNQLSNTSASIAPPIDSVGDFIFNVKIIDDFGCEWDTVSPLTVVQTPVVNLGEDIALCEMTSVQLDAGNETPTASYVWSPTGETTRVITAAAPENSASEITYTVLVTEYNGSIYCYGQDDIKLIVHPAATASFTSDIYPLEGCEPFSFQLRNTATNANTFEWTVGEESSSSPDPSFTFPYGTYDVKLKVTSEFGCQDSISYPAMINVFKHPVADFGWEPTNPYASDPTANIVNLTKPKDPINKYHWTIQTNRNNAYDVDNVFGENPSYTWTPQSGQSVAGDYNIHLDAYSVNLAPSGYIYECHDTITRVITIINDNLIFPTVVTPNGDGVNDVFVIHNLIEGQAFPDNELAIYNRYGKRIYFVQDLRHESEFWDPAATNTPSGTYFYRFIGRGPVRDVEFKGSIEVIR